LLLSILFFLAPRAQSFIISARLQPPQADLPTFFHTNCVRLGFLKIALQVGGARVIFIRAPKGTGGTPGKKRDLGVTGAPVSRLKSDRVIFNKSCRCSVVLL